MHEICRNVKGTPLRAEMAQITDFPPILKKVQKNFKNTWGRYQMTRGYFRLLLKYPKNLPRGGGFSIDVILLLECY